MLTVRISFSLLRLCECVVTQKKKKKLKPLIT